MIHLYGDAFLSLSYFNPVIRDGHLALPTSCSPIRESTYCDFVPGACSVDFSIAYPRIFSSFFRAGQVIETFRGRGIYQPAVNDAVRKLDEGAWIHLFPEGYVNQPSLNPSSGLFRFRWGV